MSTSYRHPLPGRLGNFSARRWCRSRQLGLGREKPTHGSFWDTTRCAATPSQLAHSCSPHFAVRPIPKVVDGKAFKERIRLYNLCSPAPTRRIDSRHDARSVRIFSAAERIATAPALRCSAPDKEFLAYLAFSACPHGRLDAPRGPRPAIADQDDWASFCGRLATQSWK